MSDQPPFETVDFDLPIELDRVALDKLRALDPSRPEVFVRLVLSTYQRTLDSHLAELLQACEQRDADTAIRLVHSFKSSSAYVGAMEFASLCARTESLMRRHEAEGQPAALFADRAVQEGLLAVHQSAAGVRQAIAREIGEASRP